MTIDIAASAPAAIKTDRLLLRPLRRDDAPAICEALSSWEVVKNLARVPWPYELADAEMFIAKAGERAAAGEEHTFVVDDGSLVGAISVRGIEDGDAAVGYWLAEPAWGRGYATEALQALVDYVFKTLPVASLSAGVITDNPASMRVLEKAGFVRSGPTQCATLARGDQAAIDHCLTRAAWERS